MDNTDRILIVVWLIAASVLGYLLVANWNEAPLLFAIFSPIRGF